MEMSEQAPPLSWPSPSRAAQKWLIHCPSAALGLLRGRCHIALQRGRTAQGAPLKQNTGFLLHSLWQALSRQASPSPPGSSLLGLQFEGKLLHEVSSYSTCEDPGVPQIFLARSRSLGLLVLLLSVFPGPYPEDKLPTSV